MKFKFQISNYVVALVLALFVSNAYLGSLNSPFQFDDSHTIQNNISVQNFTNFWNFWIDSNKSSVLPENSTYRPLTFQLLTVGWWLGDGQPWGFRILKIFLHWVMAYLVFFIFCFLFKKINFEIKEFLNSKWLAFFLALIYCVHPALSESVLYISAITSQLSGTLFLLALLTFIFYYDSHKKSHLIFSLISYFLAIMAKEEGITLIAILVLIILFVFKESKLKILWPYFFVASFAASILYFNQPEFAGKSRGTLSPTLYFITQWRAYLFYMSEMFFPWKLNVDNISFEFSKSITDLKVVIALILNLSLLITSWFCRKKIILFPLGLLWFYIAISPTSSVVVLAEAVNDHRMGIGFIGLLIAIFGLMLHLLNRKIFLTVTLVAMVFFLNATINRVETWSDSEKLWIDTIVKNPKSGRALNNLAVIYLKLGRHLEALELINKCIHIWPNYINCRVNSGVALSALDRLDEAEQDFKKALLLDQEFVYANFLYGKFLIEQKRKLLEGVNYVKKAYGLSHHQNLDIKNYLEKIINLSTSSNYALKGFKQ